MAKQSKPATRYRLSVPEADESTLAWIDAQLNLSYSIRMLIREDIQRNGCTDVSCRAVEQGAKRGRPSNAELERRMENVSASVGDEQPLDKPERVRPLNVSEGPSGASEDGSASDALKSIQDMLGN